MQGSWPGFGSTAWSEVPLRSAGQGVPAPLHDSIATPTARQRMRQAWRAFFVLSGALLLLAHARHLGQALWPRPPPLAACIRDAPELTVCLSTSPAAELRLLPRIGAWRARAIVEDREARGPFPDLQALARVHGIGPKTVALLERLEGLRVRAKPGP